MPGNVVIYRLGSLGDAVVSLPLFKLAARGFPDARRILLTNSPIEVTPVANSIVDNMGIIHETIAYRNSMRDLRELWLLNRRISHLRPEALIYMTARFSPAHVFRDIMFFRACGIRHIIGAPTTEDLRLSKYDPTTGLWEREAVRLARCLSSLGDARLADRGSWSLDLTEGERAVADDHLRNWNGGESFICVSAGAKLQAKDWTIENWTAAMAQLSARYPDLGAAFLGAGSERQRADALCSVWRGPKLNLCGKLTPRVSASVIERAKLFLGHDSGPMHLAAAVHTPIVAIFSARARPGIWFPNQEGAEIFYRNVSCSNCNLKVCTIEKKRCLTSITPEQVTTACCRKLEPHKPTMPAALIANISRRQ